MDELQFEYVREWMETYLKTNIESTGYSYVDEQIMQNNEIRSLLKLEVQPAAQGSTYKYVVTGRKTLNMAYSILGLKLKDINTVLNGLLQAFQQAREYLLRENGLLIDGEYIFLDKDMKEVSFIYLPGFDRPFAQQLTTFLQKLINMVDYTDREAVDVLYKCYSAIAKDLDGIQEIKAILEEYQGAAETIPGGKPDSIMTSVNEVNRAETDGFRSDNIFETFGGISNTIEKKDLLDRLQLPQWMRNIIGKKEDKKESTPVVTEELMEEDLLLEKYEESDEPSQTVYLSKQCESDAPSLLNLNNNILTPIDNTSFTIGSLKDSVSLWLPEEGVSRLHAKITKKGQEYYLEDLNSLNGTLLNDKELLPGSKSQLLNNDKITIAKTRFVFKNSKLL